jgi:cell wall-associated NlpC family hydrolase
LEGSDSLKLKSTVVVLGTAAFMNLLTVFPTFAAPKVDMAQQATDRSLTAAISKLKSYEQRPAQEALPKTVQPTANSQATLETQYKQTVKDVTPVKPQPEVKTPQVPEVKEDKEDVVTLDLTPKAKAPQTARKTTAAPKKAAAPATKAKAQTNSISKEEALDRRRSGLARMALSFRGTPYVWGGDSPRAFDCSGFTQYLYKKYYGIRLPHNAKMQYGVGKSVSRDALSIGDLVFFNTRGPLTHVGMYIGIGNFIHAANPRRGVRVDALAGYYMKVFAGAKRYR